MPTETTHTVSVGGRTYTFRVPTTYTRPGSIQDAAALADRNKALVAAYLDGSASFAQLGEAFGMSSANAHMIVKRTLGPSKRTRAWRSHTEAHILAVAEASPSLTHALSRLRIAHYRLRAVLARHGRTDIEARWQHAARERRTKWTAAHASAALDRWIAAHGRPPLKREADTASRAELPHPNTVRRLFGSWEGYLATATTRRS